MASRRINATFPEPLFTRIAADAERQARSLSREIVYLARLGLELEALRRKTLTDATKRGQSK